MSEEPESIEKSNEIFNSLERKIDRNKKLQALKIAKIKIESIPNTDNMKKSNCAPICKR